MRKGEYLSSRSVKDFILWIETILDTPQSFVHSYVMKKGRKLYEFDNLYAAYEKYDWTYQVDIEKLSAILVKSIREADEHACENACHGILKWGGVLRGNKERVSRLRPDLSAYLSAVKARLSEDLASSEYFFPQIQVTSGFSKLYSACIDNYMIYDSRVGAALGLLVRNFCINANLPYVPSELQFAWARGLESKNTFGGTNRRNPSRNGYVFSELRYHKPEEYFENNIRANWLVSEIARTTKSRFTKIGEPLRLRALEQALFMVGYDVSGT